MSLQALASSRRLLPLGTGNIRQYSLLLSARSRLLMKPHFCGEPERRD